VITARDDPAARTALNAADVVTPDGMPIVWALRSLGVRRQQRVYGPTLMLELCREAGAGRRGIFLYGSSHETLRKLSDRLVEQFAGIRIVGLYAPPYRPLTPEEDLHVQQLIRAADPDLVFVGISTPKQEKWMYEHRASFPGVTMVGVGAAFDFHAGRVRQAPGWMQRNGLEWLFRLMVDPRRLWRRYVLITPRFIPLFLAQRFRLMRKLHT
jgi:N-acetylglucosaminyldiphosphoundecaprenol N-acetyl-beta-D-mannosaminyltransferase